MLGTSGIELSFDLITFAKGEVDILINKSAPILVLVIGIGLMLASLLVEVFGIGDDPGFGFQATTGTIVGVIITAVGLYLVLKAK